MPKYNKCLSLFLLSVLIVITACNKQENLPLRIATAANMQFAMEALVDDFEKKTEISCEIITGSSGKLTAQIKAGAPYDIFASADMEYPNELSKNGLTTDAPKVYAYGTLVLWTTEKTDSLSVSYLNSDRVKHIAVADEKLAPYGAAAMQYLEATGMKERLKDKFVFAQSISGVNQYITSKTAEAGFTAKSVVVSPEMKATGCWIAIPQTYYDPIAQGAVLLKQNEASKKSVNNAKQFYNYLFSDKAQIILNQYGYYTKKDKA